MNEKISFEAKEFLQEHAESLMKQRIEKGLEGGNAPRYASFGLLVDSGGQPVLVERRTPPHEGLFSVVGGKVDLSGLTGRGKTSISLRLEEDGLESPTDTMVRELAEEMYKDLANKSADELIKIFDPKRKMTVFDYNNNAYNFLYTLQKPEQLEFQTSAREVGQIKNLSEIQSNEINPMTFFMLNRLAFKSELPKTLNFGPIGHMALPSDCLSADENKLKKMSKELHEPAYLIQY